MSKNIKFTTKEISEFYGANRNKWMDFYPSERWVFEKIIDPKKGLGDIIDIGCACGGLYKALSEKFKNHKILQNASIFKKSFASLGESILLMMSLLN